MDKMTVSQLIEALEDAINSKDARIKELEYQNEDLKEQIDDILARRYNGRY